MIVADAPVLMALAKMRGLELLNSVYGEVLIGPQVKAETVDASKRISAAGVERIEKALDERTILNQGNSVWWPSMFPKRLLGDSYRITPLILHISLCRILHIGGHDANQSRN